jgi:hypothetical protein
VKRNPAWLSLLGSVSLLFPLQSPAQKASLNLEGTWRLLSYVKADTQTRYATDGYMMFGKNHWLHVAFFNRDPRDKDFSEAHHGTYEITGPDRLTLDVDMELHMDPKTEFQETPVWYGAPAHLEGAKYRQEGNRVIIDLPSTAQLVLERIE